MKSRDYIQLGVSIVAVQAAGLIGTIFTVPAIDGWYRELVKPELSPPNWLFGPVWTILYLLMGISAYLVWREGWEKKRVRVALMLFTLQLVLNSLWSVIFFGLQSPAGALVNIGLMWIAILVTIFAFGKVSKLASWLLIPYILWVSFAAYLNYSIFILNK